MADYKEFINLLKSTIKGDVWSDDHSLGMYSTDASVYQIQPIVIVLPKDEEDVKVAVKAAKEYHITILPRGGGTSLAGQTVGHSMILDFSKYMNKVLELNKEEKWVRVQPGIVLDVLNDFLKPHALHFAPDPATGSRANVGGMVGNNSSGTKSILYGKTVDHVLEAKVLLADETSLHLKSCAKEEIDNISRQNNREGEIYRGVKEIITSNHDEIKARFPKVMRRVGGYNLDEFVDVENWNLSKLICGSEGTLAITNELKLNLEPTPKYKSVCVAHFDKLLQAIEAVEPILSFMPAAVEILDDTVVRLSRENLITKRSCHFIEGNPEAILIIEFYSQDKDEVMERPRRMIQKLKELGFGYAWPLFPEGPDYTDVWIIRKKGLGLMLGVKGGKKPLPFIEDAGIPTKVLPEYIDRVLKLCANHDTQVAMYAHASVGVIHVRPILDLRLEEDIKRFDLIAKETFDLVMEYGGSWSGEHGDGLVRSAFNEEFFGSQIYGALKEVKQLFDPENRMNPGKIVDSPPIIENLRYGQKYKDEEVTTTYHFKTDISFGDAVHMCTGVGECKKILGGTMCPSFKATRDEEHSTRGRANALRMAMSNQLEEGLASDRIHDVMDLCLSCKACKSECPSNVDMAKLKSEVSQAYYDTNGTKLRDRLIRDSTKMAAKLSGTGAGLINTIQKTSLFKGAMDRIGGFDKRRNLPEYASQTFVQWFNKNGTQGQGDTIALFADTYLNYHEPTIGIAAYELLKKCGYNVEVAEVGCCQRPKISHGFLREAKKEGTKTAHALDYWLDKGVPVLVCEPSCASALNDDLPDMIDEEPLAERLSTGVMMIDQFLANEVKKGNLKAKFTSKSKDILIHGHCHQKALYGTDAMKQLLAEDESVQCSEIPSGCCGMAGSFGYEKEHYDLSEKIGEEILFPAVKSADPNTEVIACGFSCRHQIKDFTNKKAKHWIELIDVQG